MARSTEDLSSDCLAIRANSRLGVEKQGLPEEYIGLNNAQSRIHWTFLIGYLYANDYVWEHRLPVAREFGASDRGY